MEEMSSAVAVTLSLGNSVCESSGIPTQVEITRLKLVTDTASLLLDPATVLPADPVSGGSGKGCNLESGHDTVIVPVADNGGGSGEGGDLLEVVAKNGSGSIAGDAMIQECGEDEILSTVDDTIGIVLSTVDDTNGIISEDLLALDKSSGSELTLPVPVEVQTTQNGQVVTAAINLGKPSTELESSGSLLAAAVSPQLEISDGSDVRASAVVFQLPNEKNLGGGARRSVFELDCVPLWGSICIRGRRPEMEDAVAAVPWSVKIPIKMLISHHGTDRISQRLSHLPSHFFGVYDGHGGSQVANYCCDRIHLALVEEMEVIKDDLGDESTGGNCQVQWETVFTSCFVKVDDEVGGKINRDITMDASDVSCEPVAPETVGSTAVVALICSSHLIVANCGDSRAVLCRGREAVALSVDHKPNREDEYARIEASGGKVIQWNGHRVFGVLAMSRSIGDRYLKPWIIPKPEVMLIPRAREDECLILASDGLWDVMTNEEVCEIARRRILLWYKKNGTLAPLAERGKGVDPAAQAAAEYLSVLALQKGSKDNISVVVVDLKAQRKFKNKKADM
ncbi:protein phosphatase 2C 50 [Malania oleifera]|uniref:protein phosphatase 2C 50 n=1 Tax=Malania oleifera TaxID=397392 RepID=UPI0025ADD283|nr:protein phosphatase 2C 50 [Malania oleifera]XP_057975913.1 protein phosphatase 2C 50 [Malania oleifera]XP_057975914.1 protein phosphatase 2C 50 [Malania oleifera]XP_057975915.1 protein phosphatase 2C 50 [Malania oleifera]XP_057975916.1 protein phosphatase 2C 50 [Malania oleifera]XP_057975917.1 protein phosphatase 2C 50 [Malania oleifera]XP_057975918.1 protein phosphatase 2C 50 [Malania oleifera]